MLNWFFTQAWRWTCGLSEAAYVLPGQHPSLASLRTTECDPEFLRMMDNRLLMGSFRYGLMADPDKWTYDLVAGARKKLAAYEETGNLEHLVDVANYARLEFLHPSHPAVHFRAEDDHSHCPDKV